MVLDNSVNRNYLLTHPVPPEGRIMIVTARWRGMRWTLWRQAGFARRAKTFAAYGDVVWSWRRDPGVKPCGKSRMATVAKEAAHRGEHEAVVKTIARGKPVFWLYL